MAKVQKFIGCSVKQLPEEDQVEAALAAASINPVNQPVMSAAMNFLPDDLVEGVMAQIDTPQFLAALTTKYWGSKGVRLGVSFLDNPKQDLIDRIISHANAWRTEANANVSFSWSKSQGEVRVSFGPGGYWSYLGTDIRRVSTSQNTMNLEGFTMKTPESEFVRVVRHEFGHTMGFPHEHMRAGIIAKLDRKKVIDYFKRYQKWSETTTVSQVLTPVNEKSVMGSPESDEDSIMCYMLPGSITKDGNPVRGGLNFSATDKKYAAKIYPMEVKPSDSALSSLPLKFDLMKKVVFLPKGWAAQYGEPEE